MIFLCPGSPSKGTQIHALALHPEKKMALIRSAGSYGVVVAHTETGAYAQVRLQSGEIRKVLKVCSLRCWLLCQVHVAIVRIVPRLSAELETSSMIKLCWRKQAEAGGWVEDQKYAEWR